MAALGISIIGAFKTSSEAAVIAQRHFTLS